MSENVQPINYFIKWSSILFNTAHVKHYLLLLMIWDFDLGFSIFLTFRYFWALTLVSIRKLLVLNFDGILTWKLNIKDCFLYSSFAGMIMKYTITNHISSPPSLLEISGSGPGFVFKKKPPKKVLSKETFFYNKQVFLNWFM